MAKDLKEAPKSPPRPNKAFRGDAEPSSADGSQGARDEIRRKIGEILPKDQREQVVELVAAIFQREAFSGPIAHPEHLQAYEDVCPGAVERIIAMAEREQQSRLDVQSAEIDLARQGQADDRDDRRRGMNFGFAAFSGLVVSALVAGYWGQPWLGGAFLGTGVFSVIAVFVDGRRRG